MAKFNNILLNLRKFYPNPNYPNLPTKLMQSTNQWRSKTIKLQVQDQDHLFFQDQDRSGQDQDRFFKTKTAFFKDHQIINPRPMV